jgi:hypothetical protein
LSTDRAKTAAIVAWYFSFSMPKLLRSAVWTSAATVFAGHCMRLVR